MFTQNSLNLVARIAFVFIATSILVVGGLFAQCSVTGFGNINGNVNYGDPINWANPNRVTISDDLYARAKMDAGETSKYLMVADFGFALAPGATILGIEVKVEVKQDNLADAADASIRLMKTGTATGADRAGTGIYEDKDTTNTYGSSVDLWGTTWTAADINDPGFGVLVSVTRNSGPTALYVYIDRILVTVYYNDGGCILPVELVAFDGTRNSSNDVSLTWITATETENSYFSIERSLDAVNFASIGTVASAGDGSLKNNYAFNDVNAIPNTLYYRLRQVDQNGSFSYSKTIAVAADQLSDLNIVLWPNPAGNQIHLSGQAENATLRIIDMSGRLVIENKLGDFIMENYVDHEILGKYFNFFRISEKFK